jgi:hypothetical protein
LGAQRQRREIFVENQPPKNFHPVRGGILRDSLFAGFEKVMVRFGHRPKMPLLTELENNSCYVLQRFRAYGAADNRLFQLFVKGKIPQMKSALPELRCNSVLPATEVD